MFKKQDHRRHMQLSQEIGRRVQRRVALARALAQRTRMMIVKLDRQLQYAARRPLRDDA